MRRQGDAERLMRSIRRRIGDDFADMHLTGNLNRTIKMGKDEKGDYFIRIPAVRYDLWKYLNEGVYVQTPEDGSYAELVDVEGGLSGIHKGYVERAIEEGVKSVFRDREYRMRIGKR